MGVVHTLSLNGSLYNEVLSVCASVDSYQHIYIRIYQYYYIKSFGEAEQFLWISWLALQLIYKHK